MLEEKELPNVEAPSRKAIAKATGIAFVVALVILFVAVLPAEYGIDPLKTGQALHLTDLAKATEASKGKDAKAEAKPEPIGARPTAAPAGIYTAQPRPTKLTARISRCCPTKGLRSNTTCRKAREWFTPGRPPAKVLYEFHGEPDKKPNPDYFESYELDDKVGNDHSYGSFTAPTTGIHGWFWQNKGNKPVDIHLTTAGFYDSAKMYAGDKPDELEIHDAK